jgi:hypothetical protein
VNLPIEFIRTIVVIAFLSLIFMIIVKRRKKVTT